MVSVQAQNEDERVTLRTLQEEALSGKLIENSKALLPRVPWGPSELAKVLVSTAIAATVTQLAIAYLDFTPFSVSNVKSLGSSAKLERGDASWTLPGLKTTTAPEVSTAARNRLAAAPAQSSITGQSADASQSASTHNSLASGSATSTTLGTFPFTPDLTMNNSTLSNNKNEGTSAQSSNRAMALKHVATEASLLASTCAILYGALGSSRPRAAGMFSYTFTKDWAVATTAICCVLFPVIDPLIFQAWGDLLNKLGVANNQAGSWNALVQQLLSCRESGDGLSVAMHAVASSALGPIWEETFWRGFFLASLTRVLPLPACVAISSIGFAALHLTPANLLPILLLAPCGDLLFLRSASLGPPIMLHAAWNGYQLLAIAVGGKDYFV